MLSGLWGDAGVTEEIHAGAGESTRQTPLRNAPAEIQPEILLLWGDDAK